MAETLIRILVAASRRSAAVWKGDPKCRALARRGGGVIGLLIVLWLLPFWLAGAQPLRTGESAPAGRGLPARARVVIVEDPHSVIAFNPVPEVVEQMVNQGIVALTGRETPAAAWRSLVSTQDIVGIKVFSAPGATTGTRPAVVAAVVRGLINAGLPPRQIVIWDKRLADLRLAGFGELADRFGVALAGSADEGYDENCSYDMPLLGRLVWGDLEFGKKGEGVGRRSFVSKLLTRRVTRIINIAPLLNHNLAQVSGVLYSLTLGSVDNTIRFESAPNAPVLLSQAIPELYAVPEIGDRVVLSMVDALICQYEGEERTLLHYSTMLNQVRLSQDPVALDVLSIQELERQRRLARIPPVKINWQIYTNAALMDLGVSDARLMDVIRLRSGERAD